MCVWGWGMYFSDSPREKRKATRGAGILRRAFHPFPMPSAGSPLLKRPRDTWETPGISSFHSVLWALYYQKGTASKWILQQTNGNIDIIITCTVVPTGSEKCYTQLVLCLPVSKSPNPSESLAYDLSPVKPLCYRMREKQISTLEESLLCSVQRSSRNWWNWEGKRWNGQLSIGSYNPVTCPAGLDLGPKSLPHPLHFQWRDNLGHGSPGMMGQLRELGRVSLSSVKFPSGISEGSLNISLSDYPFKIPNFWSKCCLSRKTWTIWVEVMQSASVAQPSPTEHVHK